jgi:hypothetical protein
MNFPKDWPQSCPPADAVDAVGEVFRIVRNSPPAAGDMASHHETGRLPKAPPCLRCGLSVFREVRDALHQRELLPKLGKFIAKGVLKPEHGKTKLTDGTQPTHTTWWAYEGMQRESIFIVREEEP